MTVSGDLAEPIGD